MADIISKENSSIAALVNEWSWVFKIGTVREILRVSKEVEKSYKKRRPV